MTSFGGISSHIINGTQIDIKTFSFILLVDIMMTVYVTNIGNIHMKMTCGGNYIGNNLLVTAAHCVSTFTNYTADAWGLVRSFHPYNRYQQGIHFDVESIHVHPHWNHSTYSHDIAIIRVANNLSEFGIQPIGLTRSYNISEPLYVAGFGKTDAMDDLVNNTLLETMVKIYPKTFFEGLQIDDSMLIAGSPSLLDQTGNDGFSDACVGDSGGPLFTGSRLLIGIVSWGRGCGQAMLPGVYTNVSAHLDWIQSFFR